MNKWIAVVVLDLMVLTAAVGLRVLVAPTANAQAAQASGIIVGPLPQARQASGIIVGPLPQAKHASRIIVGPLPQ